MFFYWTLLIIAAFLGVVNGAPRIVGGDSTSIERYPSLVQVDYRHGFLFWSQTCAANILTAKHLVTVAHCFGGFLFFIEQRRIRAGSSFRDDGGTIYEIESYIAHPSYGKNDFDGDIAVLTLRTRMAFNTGTQPIKIVDQNFELADDLIVRHAGWGTTRVGGGGSPSSRLHHIEVYSIKHDLCVERYKQLRRYPDVTDNMICAGVLDATDKDTCEGDEGGPLILGDVLVGIVSWGYSCANAYYPRVNTRIASYSDWIYKNIQ